MNDYWPVQLTCPEGLKAVAFCKCMIDNGLFMDLTYGQKIVTHEFINYLLV